MLISRTGRSFLLATILASCVSMPLANADPGERGGGRGGPPQEAFDACVGKVEGDACAFSGRRGDAEGTCIAPPRGDEDVLACAPERGQRGRGPRDDQEAG